MILFLNTVMLHLSCVPSEECIKPPERQQDTLMSFHKSASSKDVMGSSSTLQVFEQEELYCIAGMLLLNDQLKVFLFVFFVCAVLGQAKRPLNTGEPDSKCCV